MVCNFLKSREHVSDYIIGDYAAIFTCGHVLNNMLSPDIFYPNLDRIHTVLFNKDMSHDESIVSNAAIETLRARHFRPPATATVSSSQPNKVVVVDQ